MGRIQLPRARWLIAWAALAVLVGAGLINGLDRDDEVAAGEGEWVFVARIIDGDTVIVSTGESADGDELRVRLIGVDTPETVHPSAPVQCFGPEASAFVTDVLDGERVRLEYDSTQGRFDQYGRALAYVWLDDDTLVNELIIAQGYGREYTYRDPYRHRDRLLAAQAEAASGNAGLWSPRTCAGDTDRPAER